MGGSESSSEYQNHGFRVLNILPNSPISKTNIRRMVDFICYEPDSDDDVNFNDIIMNHKDKEMNIVVYNLINQDKRIEKIIPSDSWGGNSLLGAAIRYENYSDAHRFVAYVSDVYDNSRAFQAGLKENKDYILGTEFLEIKSLEDIGTLARVNIENPIDFIVYNSETCDIREVQIIPKDNWGGDGLLGCELYMGISYTIPPSLSLSESISKVNVSSQEVIESNENIQYFSDSQLSESYQYIPPKIIDINKPREEPIEIITEVVYEEINDEPSEDPRDPPSSPQISNSPSGQENSLLFASLNIAKNPEPSTNLQPVLPSIPPQEPRNQSHDQIPISDSKSNPRPIEVIFAESEIQSQNEPKSDQREESKEIFGLAKDQIDHEGHSCIAVGETQSQSCTAEAELPEPIQQLNTLGQAEQSQKDDLQLDLHDELIQDHMQTEIQPIVHEIMEENRPEETKEKEIEEMLKGTHGDQYREKHEEGCKETSVEAYDEVNAETKAETFGEIDTDAHTESHTEANNEIYTEDFAETSIETHEHCEETLQKHTYCEALSEEHSIINNHLNEERLMTSCSLNAEIDHINEEKKEEKKTPNKAIRKRSCAKPNADYNPFKVFNDNTKSQENLKSNQDHRMKNEILNSADIKEENHSFLVIKQSESTLIEPILEEDSVLNSSTIKDTNSLSTIIDQIKSAQELQEKEVSKENNDQTIEDEKLDLTNESECKLDKTSQKIEIPINKDSKIEEEKCQNIKIEEIPPKYIPPTKESLKDENVPKVPLKSPTKQSSLKAQAKSQTNVINAVKPLIKNTRSKNQHGGYML